MRCCRWLMTLHKFATHGPGVGNMTKALGEQLKLFFPLLAFQACCKNFKLSSSPFRTMSDQPFSPLIGDLESQQQTHEGPSLWRHVYDECM